jgi:hypothetical protein
MRTSIKDDLGSYILLDDNWAEFPKRMGFRSTKNVGQTMETAEFNNLYRKDGKDFNLSPEKVLSLLSSGQISDQIPGTIPAYFLSRMNLPLEQRVKLID